MQTRQCPALVLAVRGQQELPRRLSAGTVTVVLLPGGSLASRPPRFGQQRRIRPVHAVHQPGHVSRNRPALALTGQYSGGPQQQMPPVDHLAGEHEVRLAILERLEAGDERLGRAQSVRAHCVFVPVQPSNALQQEIDRGQIRDEQVCIDVEGLLGELGRHQDETYAGQAWRPRAQQTQTLLRQIGTPAHREAGMQKPHFGVAESATQFLIDALRPPDGVADDERGPAVGKFLRQQITHGGIRLGLQTLSFLTRGPCTRQLLRHHAHSHGQVRTPALRRVRTELRLPGRGQPGGRDTRIALRRRQVNLELLPRGRPRKVGLEQRLPLNGGKRRGEDDHGHARLPQPAQRLREELAHVHVARVDLVQHHDLAREPCHPQHHMPCTGGRVQKLIDGAHDERGQEPALRSEEPLRRGPTLLPSALFGLDPVGVVVHPELVDTLERSVRAGSRVLQQGLPLTIEGPLAVQEDHPGREVLVDGLQPPPRPGKHGIAGRLGRHPHEDTVRTEPGGQYLRRCLSSLRLALPHGRLDHHQPRTVHAARSADDHGLRRPRRIAEPGPKRLGRRTGQSPPALPKAQRRPRGRRPFTGGTQTHLPEVVQTVEVTFVAGDPVRHDHQTTQLQLERPRRDRRGLQLIKAAEPELLGENLQHRLLNLTPSPPPPQLPLGRLGLLHVPQRRKSSVMPRHQRPHPVHLLRAPAGRAQQLTRQQPTCPVVTPPPLAPRPRHSSRLDPGQPCPPHCLGAFGPQALMCWSRLPTIVNAAQPDEQPTPAPRPTGNRVQGRPCRRSKKAVPQQLGYRSSIKEVRHQQVRGPPGPLTRLAPQHPQSPHHENPVTLIQLP